MHDICNSYDSFTFSARIAEHARATDFEHKVELLTAFSTLRQDVFGASIVVSTAA